MNLSDIDSDLIDYEVIETVSRRKKVIRTRPNHFNDFNDSEYHQRFRMSKATAFTVLQLIGTHIRHPTNWNNAVTEDNMLLMTLRLYATGGMLRTIGDLYGVSASTVSRIIKTVFF